jgi:hypothetical protein
VHVRLFVLPWPNHTPAPAGVLVFRDEEWRSLSTSLAATVAGDVVHELVEEPAATDERKPCGQCFGAGRYMEQIDDERRPVRVTCERCKGSGKEP